MALKKATAAKKSPAKKPAPKSSPKSESNGSSGKMGKVAGWGKTTAEQRGLWNKSREVEPSKGGGIAEIDTGTYTAQVNSFNCGQWEDGTRWFRIGMTVLHGDFAGTHVSHLSRLNNEMGCDIASKTLKILAEHDDLKFDISNIELEEIPEFGAEVEKVKPQVQIRVKNRTYTNKKGEEVEAQDVYLNKIVDADE